MMTTRQRTIGGLRVFPIGLGCMGLSHGYGPAVSDEQARTLLLGALDAGVTLFDTAALYGFGANEELLGRILSPHRTRFTLASKCGITVGDQRQIDGSPANIKDTCERSLRRLKTDVIDLYYLHRWDKRRPIEESVGLLADLVREGKIRTIGLSEVSTATLRRAHAVHPITALQNEYSPWTRNPELGVLDACAELGVAFVAFSPVARGFLAGSGHDPARYGEGDMRASMPRFQGQALAANLRLYASFAALAAEFGCTPAQLCLAWLLAKAPHIVPIPGTTRADHARENAAAADTAFTPEAVAKVDALVNDETVAGPRYPPALQAVVDTERMPSEMAVLS